MPSFDVVNKVDLQTLDNAINTAKREITTRFDFKGSKTEIELDKKTMVINILTENELRMQSVIRVIIERMVKQGIDPKSLDQGEAEYASGNMVRKDVKVKQGIDKEVSKKMMKEIKDSKLKVQASIMDEQLRVTSKSIDELQRIIALLRGKDWGIPLQFTNMKS